MAPWGPNDSKPTLEPSPPSGIVFPPPPPAASGDACSLPICLRWIPATAARESQGPQRRLDRRGPHCPPPGGFQQLTSKPFLVSQDYPASELDSWGGGSLSDTFSGASFPELGIPLPCTFMCRAGMCVRGVLSPPHPSFSSPDQAPTRLVVTFQGSQEIICVLCLLCFLQISKFR